MVVVAKLFQDLVEVRQFMPSNYDYEKLYWI